MRCWLLLSLLMLGACTDRAARRLERAAQLSQEMIIVDGHIDVPYRLGNYPEDVSGPTVGGDFDYPRAIRGGLNAPFMSIYIPSERQGIPGAARHLADSLIDMVYAIAAHAPAQFAVATSVKDVLSHKEAGLVSLPMGIENGAPIDSLADLQHFYDRGIRYITLTHARVNQICDSSYDSTRTWQGLSPFGERVVDEMNRLGIIVDISHVTDSTIRQVLRHSKAPVWASHSSARHFTPGWERNMSDELIEALAAQGGVIMISFGSTFLRSGFRAAQQDMRDRIESQMQELGLERYEAEGVRYFESERKANSIGTVRDVADHIDHVVHLVGIDHVGLGSDFDGVTALPSDLQDVSMYPRLVAELLRRGYSDEDLAKILGGNALRVWEDVERIAAELQAAPAEP